MTTRCIDLYKKGVIRDEEFEGYPPAFRYAVLYTLTDHEYAALRYLLRQPWPHRYRLDELQDLLGAHSTHSGYTPLKTLRRKGYIALTRARYKNVRINHKNILAAGAGIMNAMGA